MDKYTLLIILNLPFVIFGIIKAISSFKKGNIKHLGFAFRIGFWGLVITGLFFAEEIYSFLVVRGLTDSTPLSIADVVLVTGLNFCLFLIIRLYTKIEKQEKRFTDLHEKIAIKMSVKSDEA